MMHGFYKTALTKRSSRKGITLLLVILVLASLMTISLGIFNVAFTELRITGDLAGSYKALNAADQGIEFMQYFYTTKLRGTAWPTDPGAGGQYSDSPSISNGACIASFISSDYIDTITIDSSGNSICPTNVRTVARRFNVLYKF